MERMGEGKWFSCMHIFLHKYITPVGGYQFSFEGKAQKKGGGGEIKMMCEGPV